MLFSILYDIDLFTSQRHQVWTTEILQLSMSLLHRIVSARHNIWLLLIGYSGLFIDMIVVLSCWWMWSVLSLFFSSSPFRISHPQLSCSQDTHILCYLFNMLSIYGNIYFWWIWFHADSHCLGLLDINFHSKLFSDFVYFDSSFSFPANNAVSSAYLRLL